MKALIVGFGSMGKRRARLLREVDKKIEILCVDTRIDRLNEAQKLGYCAITNLDEALIAKPDIAFVSTSPENHADVILQLVKCGIHTFTELNLVSDKYEDIILLAKEKKVKVFMSSTPMYKKEIEEIKRIVQDRDANKKLFYSFHIGQYLPDWHPWENYKDFFVGNKRTNAIREIFAVQLPWILDVFGDVDCLYSSTLNLTTLDIDYPDCVSVVLKHKNGNKGVFTADVAARKAISHLEIVGEDMLIQWDGHRDDLYSINLRSKEMEKVEISYPITHIDGYADNIIEEPYKAEICDFLLMVNENKESRYSLEKDKETLAIIDVIEGIKENKELE